KTQEESTREQDLSKWGLDPKKDYTLALLGGEPRLVAKSEPKGSVLLVRRKGGKDEKDDLARIEVKDGKLLFTWIPQPDARSEQQFLRDCILELKSAGKSTFVALRIPKEEHDLEFSLNKTNQDFIQVKSQDYPSRKLMFDSVELDIEGKIF